jgi:hypothetical protein
VAADAKEWTYDPHVQGLWEIAPENMQKVREYLEKHNYIVWIDRDAVRSPKRAMYYLYLGLTSYKALPGLPLEAIQGLWTLPKRRFFRAAGWYAHAIENQAPRRRVEASKPFEVAIPAQTAQSERSLQSGRREAFSDQSTGTSPTVQEQGNRSRLGNDPAKLPEAADATHIVHPVIPEDNSIIDPRLSPTLDELAFTVDLLRIRLQMTEFTFAEFCRGFGVNEAQGRRAVRCVEANFRTTLFFPGPVWDPEWKPTEEGARFFRRTTDIVDRLVALCEDFTKLARSNQRSIRRLIELQGDQREFDERIAAAGVAPPQQRP